MSHYCKECHCVSNVDLYWDSVIMKDDDSGCETGFIARRQNRSANQYRSIFQNAFERALQQRLRMCYFKRHKIRPMRLQ